MTELQIKKQVADQERDLENRKQLEQQRHNVAQENIAKVGNVIKGAQALNEFRATGARIRSDKRRDLNDRVKAAGTALKGIGAIAAFNDLEWHVKSATLLNQRGKVSDAIALGIIPEGCFNYGAGVMALEAAFTPGINKARDGYAESLAFQLYSEVRGDKSGEPPYGVGTPMMYTYAVANAMFMVSFAEKVYRIANRPDDVDNCYVRDGLFKALHINDAAQQEIISKKTRLLDDINNFLQSLARFPITNSAALLPYAFAVMSMVCRDGDQATDSLYTLVPSGYYTYSWESDSLIFNYVTQWNLAAIEDCFQNIITNLTNNSVTSRILFSDMKSSKSFYGSESGWRFLEELAYLEKDAMQAIVYDEEFLNMFAHATLAPGAQWNHMNVEFNDTRAELQFDPYFVIGTTDEERPGKAGLYDKLTAYIKTQEIYRTDFHEVDPGSLMLSTRWKHIAEINRGVTDSGDNIWSYHLKSCPNVLITAGTIVDIYTSVDANGFVKGYPMQALNVNATSFSAGATTLLLNSFKFSPDAYLFFENSVVTDVGAPKHMAIPCNVLNSWTPLTAYVFDQLNYLDQVSLLGISSLDGKSHTKDGDQ